MNPWVWLVPIIVILLIVLVFAPRLIQQAAARETVRRIYPYILLQRLVPEFEILVQLLAEKKPESFLQLKMLGRYLYTLGEESQSLAGSTKAMRTRISELIIMSQEAAFPLAEALLADIKAFVASNEAKPSEADRKTVTMFLTNDDPDRRRQSSYQEIQHDIDSNLQKMIANILKEHAGLLRLIGRMIQDNDIDQGFINDLTLQIENFKQTISAVRVSALPLDKIREIMSESVDVLKLSLQAPGPDILTRIKEIEAKSLTRGTEITNIQIA